MFNAECIDFSLDDDNFLLLSLCAWYSLGVSANICVVVFKLLLIYKKHQLFKAAQATLLYLSTFPFQLIPSCTACIVCSMLHTRLLC